MKVKMSVFTLTFVENLLDLKKLVAFCPANGAV